MTHRLPRTPARHAHRSGRRPPAGARETGSDATATTLPPAAGNALLARWMVARQPVPAPGAGARPSLVERAGKVRTEAVPALQRAIDALDAGGVVETGKRLAVAWAQVEGLRRTGGPAPGEFTQARDAVLAVLGPQTAFGGPLRPGRTLPPLEGDLTPVLVRQVEAMGSLVREAVEMVGILEKHRGASSSASPAEQARILEIWRGHPNPWHTAFLHELVRQRDLAGWLSASLPAEQFAQIQVLLGSAGWLAGEGGVRPTDPVGALEARPMERTVRVLAPQTLRELAVLLYDDEALGLRMLKAFNGKAIGGMAAEALVPAGIVLAVDPRQLGTALGLRFRAAEMMRDKVDRPTIDAEPDGPAVTGTASRYTVRWPTPETPPEIAAAPEGIRLPWLGPLKDHLARVRIEMAVEHDPAAVAEGKVQQIERFASADVDPEKMEKGVQAAKAWPVGGRHMVLASVAGEPRDEDHRYWLEANLPSGALVLRLPQPVTSAKEAADVELERLLGPKDGSVSFAKAAWMRERMAVPGVPGTAPTGPGGWHGPLIVDPKEIAAAEQLGLAGEPRLQGDPRGLLERLERHRATLPEDQRDEIDDQIEGLKTLIAEKGAEDIRQVDGVFASTEGPGVVVPLSIFARSRPGVPGTANVELIDFTLRGRPRTYPGRGASPGQALKAAIGEFADDAPYPEGLVRFAIGPWHIAGGDPSMAAETVEQETDGGVLLDDYLQAAGFGFLLVALAAAVVPGAQGLVVPMLVLSSVASAAGSAVNLYDRLEHGDFEWDQAAGLDILNVAGALLTLGMLSAATAAVQGVGQVSMLTRVAQGVNIAQLGLVVGVHSKDIAAAIRSGSLQAVANALLRAAMDGALILVVHKTAGAGGGPQRPGDPGAPASGRASPDAGGAPNTATGSSKGGSPGAPRRPPGPATIRERHEEWVATRLRPQLGPREAAPADGPPHGPGVVRDKIADPDEALAVFDLAVARTPNREVGLYWNAKDGTYLVKVGSATSIAPPGGAHEMVMHTHPNPENVLTIRMPAPADVELAHGRAEAARRQIDEAIDFELPDGRRGRTQYTVDPRGTVTIRIEGRPPRRYASVKEYQAAYGERTTHAPRGSQTYEDMWRDLNEIHGNTVVVPPEPENTATGSMKPGRPAPSAAGGGPGRAGPPGGGGAGPAPDPTITGTRTTVTSIRRGDGTPLSSDEVQALLTRAIGDGNAPTPMQVWRAADQATFASEWQAAGGNPGQLPAAFVNARGEVWVSAAGEDSVVLFHEAVHQRAILAGAREPFVNRFGSFLEEGITESLARHVMGPHASRHPYDNHVRFLGLMRQHLGVSEPMLRAAYLRGQAGPMEQHILAGVNGDRVAQTFLLAGLRNIGTLGDNQAALADVLYVMVYKRPRPQAP